MPQWMLPLGIACAIGGGLFPDIDWQTSKIGQKIKPISRVINFLFGHRTLFHSPCLYLCIWLLVRDYRPNWFWYAQFFVAGAGSHLMLDMFNAKGIPLFYPWTKHFYLAKIKSGGRAERIIRLSLYGVSMLVTMLMISYIIQRMRFYL